MNIGKLIAYLRKIGDQEVWSDDPKWQGANDYAGGNIDDAYYGGYDDGRIVLAREILTKLKGIEKGILR